LTDGRAPKRVPQQTWCILELLQVSAPFLARKGVQSSRLEAELLLSHVLECERIALYTRFDQPVPADRLDRYRELIRRRSRRVPTQYLTGRCEFMSLPFTVGPGVLIPRPETEHLVETAARYARGLAQPTLADVGTGTGNIAVSLAHCLPDARVYASDISPEVLEVARINVEKNGVTDRVELLEGDLVQPFQQRALTGAFDIVASNPPYVADGEFPGLQPEVRDHEPRLALAGGADGLDFYRRLAAEAPPLLKEGGLLMMEMADGMGGEVEEIVASSQGLVPVEVVEDYSRIRRVIVARK